MDWHRLFGLLLTDFFTGSPFVVELEKDLSLKQQFLDVVILRRGSGAFAGELPDGLDDLAAHNLVTFKSFREPLDDWALKELTGHYVNYRKQVSPDGGPLLPETEFRLYAVCVRYPKDLASEVELRQRSPGVYECRRGTDAIRVIVVRRAPKIPRNAPLHLFTALRELVRYGAEHYRRRSAETSTLLDQLFSGYRREGIRMPYTMADFKRDYIIEHFPELTKDERARLLQNLPSDERARLLQNLPSDERARLLQNLPPEDRLKGLPPEERLKGLPPEERLKGLSEEQIEAYLRSLRAEPTSPKFKSSRKRRSRRPGT